MNNGGQGGAVTLTYLDKSFGVSGKVDSDFSSTYDVVNDLILQPDGKIVAVGSTGSPRNPKFHIVRYNSNGTLDSTFKNNGKTLEFANGAVPYSSFLDSVGRIIVAGASGGAMVVIRLKKDGSLDESFGERGKISTTIGERSSAFCADVGSGDSIILGGFSFRENAEEMALVKFDKDGHVINDFKGPKGAGRGKFSFTTGAGNSRIYALQSRNDEILVAGTSYNGSNYDFTLVRLKPDGAKESAFGFDSPVSVNHNPAGDDVFKSIVWQQNGKILAVGFSATDSQKFNVVVYRFNEDGSVDQSFGSNGYQRLPWKIVLNGGALLSGFVKISVDTLNRIYVATEPTVEGRSGFGVARLTPEGQLDSSYGQEGVIFTSWDSGPNQNSAAHAMILQPDGKALLGGYSNLNSNYNFALARYRP